MTSARLVPMSSADVKNRADHARSFLAAADLVLDFGEEVDISPITNIVGSLAVLAGIAASDAICGMGTGKRSGSPSHVDALELLAGATDQGRSHAARLQTLLKSKSATHYSAIRLTDALAAELLKTARRLVSATDDVLRA